MEHIYKDAGGKFGKFMRWTINFVKKTLCTTTPPNCIG